MHFFRISGFYIKTLILNLTMTMMEERIQSLMHEVKAYLARDKKDLEAFRMKYISKKGAISELFEELRQVSAEQKKNVGKILNQLKQTAETKMAEQTENLE